MMPNIIRAVVHMFIRCPHVEVAKGYLMQHQEFKTPQCRPAATSSNEHLAWMLAEIAANRMSRTKANRWLGYVQSKMEDKGMLVVSEERDRTRSIFKGL